MFENDDDDESDASSSADEGDQAEEADDDGAPAAPYLGEANKPARAGDVTIAVRQENPKRPGSQSHARYEKYKAATTLSEFRSLGGSAADFKYDSAHGYVVAHSGAVI